MYAIIRNGKGGYDTSVVFGYYCFVSARSRRKRYWERIHNQFYVVLSADRKQLIKQPVFPWKKRQLDPLVLITDQECGDWVMDEDGHGCVDFLAGIDFASPGETVELPPELLERCIQIDAAYSYQEYVDVTDERDLRNLHRVTGGFHDAYLEAFRQSADQIYVLFNGIWGCRVELWFEGEAACSDGVWDPEEDPVWFSSALIKENGFYYLIDDDTADLKKLDCCRWLRAKKLRCHVTPNP